MIRLIGGVWLFVPVGFWWLIWVDQRGGVWVLIGVNLGFIFFYFFIFFIFFSVVIGVDRRYLGS